MHLWGENERVRDNALVGDNLPVGEECTYHSETYLELTTTKKQWTMEQAYLRVDNREGDLLHHLQHTHPTVHVHVVTLDIGDVQVCQPDGSVVWLIERKTIADLLASIKDGRYQEQSLRLQSDPLPNHNKVYLLEGTPRTDSDRSMMYSSAFTLSWHKGFSLFRTHSVAETADWLAHIVRKVDKDRTQARTPYYAETTTPKEASAYVHAIKSVKKENITKDNIGAIMLAQIPGVSSTIANTIMQRYSTWNALMQAIHDDPTCLQSLRTDKNRKLSQPMLDRIVDYIT